MLNCNAFHIKISGLLIASLLLFFCASTLSSARERAPTDLKSISMPDYFDLLRQHHPQFQLGSKQQLIETAQRQSYLGAEDWVLAAEGGLTHFQATQPQDSPSEVDQLQLGLRLERALWQTGGRVSLRWDNHRHELEYPLWQGNFFPAGDRAYEQVLSVNYAHPLLRNRHGNLDRTEFDAAEYTQQQVVLASREQEERFLLTAGMAFIDWVLFEEQLAILDRRIALSKEQINRIRKKRAANMVGKVDLLRAEDSQQNTVQSRALMESRRNSQRRKLAALLRQGGAGEEAPAVNQFIDWVPYHPLYQSQALPSESAALQWLAAHSRTLKEFKLQQHALQRRARSAKDQTQGDLSLLLGAALKGGGDNAADSFDLNKQDATVGLRFSKPLGNRQAAEQLKKVTLQLEALALQRDQALIELQSQTAATLSEMTSLSALLELNQQQIQTAQKTTVEEWRLYNQGRNDLSTVILSQDREQLAQLTYAQNGASYQRLFLQLQTLLDRLQPEPSQSDYSIGGARKGNNP